MDPANLLILALLVVALVVPFLVLVRRANELFVLDVQEGKVEVLRGRLPPALLRDLRDVLRDVPRATVTARVEGGRPMVRAEGLSEPVLQRVRNVVGRFQKGQLKGR